MIYFDNAATTPVENAVWGEIIRNTDLFGNPSSVHGVGAKARSALESARAKIAERIGVSPHNIIFTSGGTESNNIILNHCLRGGKIICSDVEHPSVANFVSRYTNDRLPVDHFNRLPVDHLGIVKPDYLNVFVDGDTNLVSVMTVNNETGAIQPVKEIYEWCKSRGILFHTDAVQAFGHLPLPVIPDAFSVSGHKFGALRGSGFIYLSDNVLDSGFCPLMYGGGQEKGLRPGTENVLGAISLAKAVDIAYENMESNADHIKMLNDRLRDGLSDIRGIHFNSDRDVCYPGILNIRVDNVEAEAAVILLDLKDICISSGSACHSGSMAPSPTLSAMGLDKVQCFNSMRISINHHNTMQEVDGFIKAFKDIVNQLRGKN